MRLDATLVPKHCRSPTLGSVGIDLVRRSFRSFCSFLGISFVDPSYLSVAFLGVTMSISDNNKVVESLFMTSPQPQKRSVQGVDE